MSSKLIFAPGENPSDSQAPSRAAQFKVGTLHRTDLNPDPFVQFHSWFSDPRLNGSTPETCTLSTAHLPSGRVSSRMVYLKELDDRGFVIYSNFGTSQKASDLATNPYASLTFWHKPTERQVRVEGLATRLTPAESQVYYDTRARGSRIGAWASQQTSILEPQSQPQPQSQPEPPASSSSSPTWSPDDDDGRAILDTQVAEIETRFEGQETIPVPPFWGGLRIVPDMIEFWQGRESRLHDRFRYTVLADGDAEADGHGQDGKTKARRWKIERLSP